MTDDQHGEGAPQPGNTWEPLPQGDYDDGATAFVKLPEGGIEALLDAHSPLAAPGHGYVPPQIPVSPAATAGTDPAALGWPAPADDGRGGQHAGYEQYDESRAGGWPEPGEAQEAPQQPAQGDFAYYSGATGQNSQWTYEEPVYEEPAQGFQDPQAPQAPVSGHDVTGQWSIPVAGGDLPDESGEFTTSALVEQWGGTPPSTLPGGAPAPWATEPWSQQQPAAPAGHAPEEYAPAGYEQPAEYAPAEQEPAGPTVSEYGPDGGDDGRAAAEQAAAGGTPVEDAPAEDAPAEDAGAAADGQPAPDGPAEEAAPEEHEEPDGTADAAPEGHAAPEEPASDQDAGEPAPEAAAAAREPEDAAQDAVQDTASEAGAPEEAPAGPPPQEERPLASYVLRVNGVDRPVSDAWIGESLLYVLRERLGLAGAKDGCSQGECGACNVQVDGRLVASCLVPAVTTAGSEVRTVEGLAADGQPSDVQRALARCGAVQCGFCVPGMAMTVHDLLEGNPAPTDLETRQALCGNLCRCSGYRGVLEAVREVVAEREAHASAEAEPEAEREQEQEQAAEGLRIPHQAGPGDGGVNPAAYDGHDGHAPQDPYMHDQQDPYAHDPQAQAPHQHEHPPHPHPHDGGHEQPYGQDGGQA